MIRGVLFDWRGTLVADPPDEWWVEKALERLGRERRDAAAIVEALDVASRIPDIAAQLDTLDCSAEQHRTASMSWFVAAGLDDELASVLYALDFEAANHPFFPDVAGTLRMLHEQGIATGVVSDIHFDLRPEFEAAGLTRLVDAFVLSFEHGLQKPDPQMFRIAADALALAPHELLMVGDRASHDGGAAACGITTLLVPPDRNPAHVPRGLGVVIAMVNSGV